VQRQSGARTPARFSMEPFGFPKGAQGCLRCYNKHKKREHRRKAKEDGAAQRREVAKTQAATRRRRARQRDRR